MAYSESEVPEGVRDILAYMPREMRQRVLADYETHYAPFLNHAFGLERRGAGPLHSGGRMQPLPACKSSFFRLATGNFRRRGWRFRSARRNAPLIYAPIRN